MGLAGISRNGRLVTPIERSDAYDSRSSTIVFNFSSNLPTHKKITAPVQKAAIIKSIAFS